MEAADLSRARKLSLGLIPASEPARALVAAVLERVTAWETAEGSRKKRRSIAEADALASAVAVLAGGTMRGWSRLLPAPVSHSLQAAAFSGAPVGVRVFKAAAAGMEGAGLVHHARGTRFGQAFGTFSGWVSRWWPSAALLALAADHGMLPAEVDAAFVHATSLLAPAIREPVVLRPLVVRKRKTDTEQAPRARLPLPHGDAELNAILADVRAHNALASETEIAGCSPPRWYRTFTGTWRWGGRWIAAGSEETYQNLRGGEARRIELLRIAGEPAAEVDIRASHLRLVYALLHRTMPEGDPYAIPNVPREVVKAWLLQALGKGRTPHGWSSKTPPEIIKAHPMKRVRGPIITHHQVLDALHRIGREGASHPAAVVAEAMPWQLVTHVLQGTEARILTAAMRHLRDRPEPILSLPMHDGLIVPVSAVSATVDALGAAWSAITRTVPLVLTVARHGQDREIITVEPVGPPEAISAEDHAPTP